MIFDLVAIAFLFFEIKRGFSDGFIKGLLKTIGYIAGAVGGLYLALQYNRSGWVIIAILVGANLGSVLGGIIAKGLKVTVIRGPLAWVNSWAGALLHGAKVIILIYLVGTVMLWAPWPAAQNAIATSKVYLKLDTYAPAILADIKDEIGKRFERF